MNQFHRVLVTGGAGFIGSHLVNKLLGRGYEVAVLDNFRSGKMENIRQHLKNDGFMLVKGDVRDKRAVRDSMDGVDAVVHLAALIDVEESVNNPFDTHDVNVGGTLNVLEEAVRKGIKRFVYASSTAVYGEGNPLPLKEDHPLKPISPYAASKASAEHYCRAFGSCYGLNSAILRYFNVYGPGQRRSSYSGVITRFFQNALKGEPLIIYGDGEQTRDFIYVDDVVDATILALEKCNLRETVNACTGKPTTIKELAQIVGEVAGKEVQILHDEPRNGDIRHNYGETAKAEEILGFKARTSLKEGLKQTLKTMS
jgi:UDP-glucose 4-epimerase